MLDVMCLRTARAARLRTLLLGAWVACLALAAARGNAQEITILRYERLADFSFTDSSDGVTPGARLSFNAFGTRFTLLLARNDALTRNLSVEALQRLDGTTFYTGTLDGNAESWVRITRTGEELSGAIWDGTELYAIELFARVAARVVAGPEVGPAESVIYRWSDALSTVTDAEGPPPASGSKDSQAAMAAKVFVELAAVQQKLSPAQQLDIGLLADGEFVQRYPAYPDVMMLAVFNIVDGIFANQVGVHINVAELHSYAEPDAFSSNDASALLAQLEDFKFGTPELRTQGLVHLLTARDLDERPGAPAGARLLGAANLGAVCDERLAVSLTQYTDVSTAAVVAAHEIGHNLGAPHDAETGSPCQSTPDGFIMNPFFNGSQQFSQCSLQQMEAKLAVAMCLKSIPANDLSIRPLQTPAYVVATREFAVDFALDYGAGDAVEPELKVTATNARIAAIYDNGYTHCNYSSGDTTYACVLSDLSATGGSATFRVQLFDAQVGPATVEIEITSLNDDVPSNNRYRFDLDVVPDARFMLASSAAPAAIRPGESFDVDWGVVNQGQVAATNARAEFRLWGGVSFVGAQTPSGAACARGPLTSSEQWLCPVGTIAPGATVPLKLTLRANAPITSWEAIAWLKMVAAEPIFDIENEWQKTFKIAPTITDVYVADLVAPASATVGSDVTVTLRVGNRGPDNAPNVVSLLRTWTGRGVTFNSATSSRGSCAKIDWESAMKCELGTLASGETVEVVAQATVDMQAQDVHVVGSADEITQGSFDTDAASNSRTVRLQAVAVSPPPPAPAPSPPSPAPSPTPAPAPAAGGGGGGAVDPTLLLLLVACLVRRFRSARQRR